MGVESLRRLGPDLDPFVQDTWTIRSSGFGGRPQRQRHVGPRGDASRDAGALRSHAHLAHGAQRHQRSVVRDGGGARHHEPLHRPVQRLGPAPARLRPGHRVHATSTRPRRTSWRCSRTTSRPASRSSGRAAVHHLDRLRDRGLADRPRGLQRRRGDRRRRLHTTRATAPPAAGGRSTPASSPARTSAAPTTASSSCSTSATRTGGRALVAINWNKTDGFYPRTVDQNWYIDGPLTMDTPFGSTLNHYQNNLERAGPDDPRVGGQDHRQLHHPDHRDRPRAPASGTTRAGRSSRSRASRPGQSWMGGHDPGGHLPRRPGGTRPWSRPTRTTPTGCRRRPSSTSPSARRSRSATSCSVGVSFDVLNALNSSAPNRVVYTAANYGLVSSLVHPRVYRLGLKLSI